MRISCHRDTTLVLGKQLNRSQQPSLVHQVEKIQEDMTTINIQEYAHVPGVKMPEPGMPEWRANMLQQKNLKIITDYLAVEDEKRKEEEKWKTIPGWKKQLMLEKEQKKKEEQREKEEAERREKEKFEKLPEWRKQLLSKKQVVGNSESSKPSENGDDSTNVSVSIDNIASEASSQTSENGENGITEP